MKTTNGGHVKPSNSAGVKYFGSLAVVVLPRPIKHWYSLLISLITVSNHIKVVNGLHIDTYMMSVTVSIARRGGQHKLISEDRGNFLGAAREFRDSFSAWDLSTTSEQLASG